MQKSIKFLKRPRLINPIIVAAWPGMGEVALRSATYLVEKLKCEPFAYLGGTDYFSPSGSVVKDGIVDAKQPPENYFYYWKNPVIKRGSSKQAAHDLIIFVSNAQPDLSKAAEYTEEILDVARLYSVDMIISFAAIPMPIDHNQNPNVWFCATDNELSKRLGPYDLKKMEGGEITGMNGLFLGLAKKQGFSGFCLLGEIPIYTIQIENPKAVFAILAVFKKIFNLSLELKPLQEQAGFIEKEINKLVDYLKEGANLPSASGPGPISEAEIEKMKKALTQLTGLPQSIKAEIDKLFVSAKKDITKANELKQKLDMWNVYKEYEDRFLDLFKKSKDKGN